MVRREAAACPPVVVAKNLVSPASPSSTHASSPPRHPLLMDLTAGIPRSQVPPHLLPSKDWTNSFVLTFASWRLQLETICLKGRSTKPASSSPQILRIPKLENEAACRQFCIGTDGTPRFPPTTTLISSLSQRQTLRLLEYHTQWLAMVPSFPHQAQWIFALLLRVDKVVAFWQFLSSCAG